jgi:hypothetical protein
MTGGEAVCGLVAGGLRLGENLSGTGGARGRVVCLRECAIDHRWITGVSAERVVKEALQLLQPLPQRHGLLKF